MSTNDVPGAVPGHNDELAMGCWAEHEDGSLIFVESVENGVVFSMFDMSTSPITEYRDSMPEQGFKNQFSWSKNPVAGQKWTWHDKTPFPWDKVVRMGASAGARFASAHDQISAAQKVAQSLQMKAVPVQPDEVEHLADKAFIGKVGNAIIKGIQTAINSLEK